MSLRTSESILLDVYDLHEYDRIVTLLTRDFGKRRGVAKGARRRFSGFSGQLRLLDTVRVTWFEKEGRDLDRISSLETIRSADALTRDLEGILLAAYLAEHMVQFAQESEENDHLYRLLDATIAALLEGVDRELATRYFEAWLLRLSGLFPAPYSCPSCGSDLARSGAVLASSQEAIVCRACDGGSAPVSAPTLEFLIRLGRTSLPDLASSPPPPRVLAECEDVCGRVRRYFLQGELKSYRVMRETLAGLPASG